MACAVKTQQDAWTGSFGICQRYVDELVKVGDDEICSAMEILFDEMKLAVEPAGAAATAALRRPLKDRLSGKRVGVMVCGSNIDRTTFNEYIGRADRAQE